MRPVRGVKGPTAERAAAAGILVLAVLLAWMILDKPDDIPPPTNDRVAEPPPPDMKADTPSQTLATVAGSLAIELVEISAPPAPATPPPPRVVPAPPVAAQAAPPPPPEPPAPAPEPEPKLAPQPEVVPLRPTVPAPRQEVMPVALQPDTTTPETIVPLRPAPPRPREEPPVVQRPDLTPLVPAPAVTPLRPTPPKPAPPPETKIVARIPAPPPVQKRAEKAPPPPAPSLEANAEMVVGEGRAFLKILEQGAGPGIEIRWPSEPAQRDRLYTALVQCLGMRTGLLDGEGRLYLGDGRKGQPSALDGERYSGFVRRPEGAIAAGEQREIARVRSFHQVRASAAAARIFPRRVDAYLIGGLRQLVGEGYLKTKAVRATYRLRNGRPVVDSIVADGRRIAGVIDLSVVASGCTL